MYGSLDNSSGLDCNLYDTILFNAMDQVKCSGYVSTVSIHFSRRPVATNCAIWLFTVQSTNMSVYPNTFEIIDKMKISSGSKIQETGVQIFTKLKIPINVGQYLAVRFSSGSGNPYNTERNQYYAYFIDEPYVNQKLIFSNCPTTGIAMSFNVQSSSSTI
jgi:hypothetical protein